MATASERPRQLVSYAADGDTTADSDMDASAIEDELEKRLDDEEMMNTPVEEVSAVQSQPAICSTNPKEEAVVASTESVISSSSSGAVVVSKPPTLFPAAAAAAVAGAAATGVAATATPQADDPLQAFYSELASVDAEFSGENVHAVSALMPPSRSFEPVPPASAPTVPPPPPPPPPPIAASATVPATSSEKPSTRQTAANANQKVLIFWCSVHTCSRHVYLFHLGGIVFTIRMYCTRTSLTTS